MSLPPVNVHGGDAQPSDWVTRWAHLAPNGAAVLDLACGGGRHLRWWVGRGHHVTGVDRDGLALAALDQRPELAGHATLLEADVENAPWPLAGRQFGVVVVTNYLWRPLLPAIVAAVAPGGLLLYETFAIGHERLGRPSRADFLLQPGELLRSCGPLQVIAYEAGTVERPARVIQRIAAVRPQDDESGAANWPLGAP